MPIGSRHELTGLLLEHNGQLSLQLDDGGCWRLEAPRHAWRMVGGRVWVVGVRDGFDLLAVIRIGSEKAGSAPAGRVRAWLRRFI